MAAEATYYLGRSVCGSAYRGGRCEGAPGRWGVWESTSLRSPWLGAWWRRYGGWPEFPAANFLFAWTFSDRQGVLSEQQPTGLGPTD